MSWWQEAVFYHIYPRSYLDSDCDGIGDIKGITSKLDYLKWLGIDAIYLSPVFPSPQADFGYDVSDFCDIDPLFGTLRDFDRLLRQAHRRDIRVIIDQVHHTASSRHPWFLESRSSRNNAKADWFIWKDPLPGGEPPNNWLSFFSGSEGEPAWEWVQERGQFYLHLFSRDQCDLDLRNPEVRREMEKVIRFWLERGVDGFRLDSISVYFKDPLFRDYLRRPEPFPGAEFSALSHYYVDNNLDRPENLLVAEGIRRIAEEYAPERVLIGESASEYGIPAYLELCTIGRLNLAFNFEFLNAAALEAKRLKEVIDRTDELFGERAWPCYVLGNHDGQRLLSRVAGGKRDPQYNRSVAKLFAALLLTLRGTPFIYYGEEIGMVNTPIPRDRVVDPFGKAVWPEPGRDVSRTPMQWSGGRNCGFSAAEPWLPVNREDPAATVEAQNRDPESILSFYRSLLSLRRRRPELRLGSYLPRPCTTDILSYARGLGDGCVEIYLNFGETASSCPLNAAGRILLGSHRRSGSPIPERGAEKNLRMEAFEVLILKTDPSPGIPGRAPSSR